MLKKSNVASVVPLAQQLQDQGYQLMLNPNVSLLDALMRANEVNYVVPNDALEETLVNRSTVRVAEVETAGLEDEEVAAVLIPNAHSQAMEELTTAAAKALNVISTLVRTHINPKVKEIANAVWAAVDGNVSNDITDFGYLTRNYNAIYNSGVVEGVVSDINTPRLMPIPAITLPTQTTEQLEALVKNANADINAGLNTFRSDNPNGLVDVYNLFFRRGGGEPNALAGALYQTAGGDYLVNLNSGALLDVPAIALIIGSALIDNPPQGVKMSLDVYNGEVSAITSAIANAVALVIQEREAQINQQLLVLEYPTISATTGRASGQMVLNGDLTDAFYNSGINMDHLIGSALQGRYATLNDLVTHKDTLEEIYKQRRSQAEVNRTINRQQFLNAAVVDQISKYFDEVDSAILEPTLTLLELANKNELRLLVLKKVRDDLFHTRVLESDLMRYLTMVFAEQIFVNPSLGDFLRIFNATEDYGLIRSDAGSDDDVRERASYTAIIMLTKLFSEAVVVKRT